LRDEERNQHPIHACVLIPHTWQEKDELKKHHESDIRDPSLEGDIKYVEADGYYDPTPVSESEAVMYD